MTMLKRLLGSLHTSVFDTSPDSGLAFFIRHPDGVSWAVSDDVLTATVDGQSRTYHLSTMTVGQLAGQLVLDGFEVARLAPEFSGLSASVLIEGAGNTLNSNGDRLYAFRDYLHALFGGYARELRTAKAQIGEALKQMVITQAEGEWLDLWGALYNTPRGQGMTDAAYQPLIPQEAFRIRVNGYAIEKAILDLTGQRVNIEEPWGSMFRLDESKLSSTHRFYDGSTVGYHLIRPVSDKTINWDGIIDIIERNKAAGVIVLPPEERNRTWVKDPLNGEIWSQQWDIWARLVKVWQLPRLDESLRLSSHSIDLNRLTSITSVHMLSRILRETNTWRTQERWASDRTWKSIYEEKVYFGASRLVTFGPVLYPQDSEIYPYHTGFHAPAYVEAYPQERKTWHNSGKWKGSQTWAKAYEWRVFSRMTSYSESSFVGGNVSGSVVSMSAQGADWSVPESWDDTNWNS